MTKIVNKRRISLHVNAMSEPPRGSVETVARARAAGVQEVVRWTWVAALLCDQGLVVRCYRCGGPAYGRTSRVRV